MSLIQHLAIGGSGPQVTKYTKDGPGTPGGSSWTPEWLKFDNSYFKEVGRRRREAPNDVKQCVFC